jgi:hypothetical protein
VQRILGGAHEQSVDPANAGLHHAITFLMPIQAANPWLSHSDLWSELATPLSRQTKEPG